MNEQLVVKNFGPITDATVDFKRVTVFIGPTGGGKSTLAKLAAIFRDGNQLLLDDTEKEPEGYSFFGIRNYFASETHIRWNMGKTIKIICEYKNGEIKQQIRSASKNIFSTYGLQNVLWFRRIIESMNARIEELETQRRNKSGADNIEDSIKRLITDRDSVRSTMQNHTGGLDEHALTFYTQLASHSPYYIPAERQLIPALNQSWPDLIKSNIKLPGILLEFANKIIDAESKIDFLTIPFLKIDYFDKNGISHVRLLNSEKELLISETASGIQSVTPLLVLLEHLSRNTEQAQSFIIEEPELNLYPTAQQGLLNWLVEKCTKGENDLTITTHSPYLLAHFNLLLYAYQVAENHPDRAEDVAKIVPRESWINPKEFAAYHVEGQQENGVRSIVNPETGLISYNGLDATANAETSEFEKLLDINAGLEVE